MYTHTSSLNPLTLVRCIPAISCADAVLALPDCSLKAVLVVQGASLRPDGALLLALFNGTVVAARQVACMGLVIACMALDVACTGLGVACIGLDVACIGLGVACLCTSMHMHMQLNLPLYCLWPEQHCIREDIMPTRILGVCYPNAPHHPSVFLRLSPPCACRTSVSTTCKEKQAVRGRLGSRDWVHRL